MNNRISIKAGTISGGMVFGSRGQATGAGGNINNGITIALHPGLRAELAQLRAALRVRARSAEDDTAIGQIASAETAAHNLDASGVAVAISRLGVAGRWVLEVATEIGTQLAVEVIKTQLRF